MILSNKIVIDSAIKLGFDLVGFAPYQKLTDDIDRLRLWLDKGYQAGMAYMEKNLDKREDLHEILPSAKSVISLGLNYYQQADYTLDENEGKISRYAFGRDYHFVIWEKLDGLISELKQIDSNLEAKSYVDTGPVMDQAWAIKAGLGWRGKNSNIISKKIGSWFFIASIICNAEFVYDKPVKDFCGTCTACIDACPTKAIVDDYTIDSNKCISYLTIENKGEIAPSLKGKFDNWIFGCDICQEVCPWNKKNQKETCEPDFINNKIKKLCYNDVKKLTNSTFKSQFAEKPILRAKAKGLKRNAEFLFGEQS